MGLNLSAYSLQSAACCSTGQAAYYLFSCFVSEFPQCCVVFTVAGHTPLSSLADMNPSHPAGSSVRPLWLAMFLVSTLADAAPALSLLHILTLQVHLVLHCGWLHLLVHLHEGDSKHLHWRDHGQEHQVQDH